MRHAASLPQMAVQPQTAIHGVDHSISPLFKFSKLRSIQGETSVYWQATTPAAVAGATAVAVPMNIAQKCGHESGFVTVAAQPVGVAWTIEIASPCDPGKFSCVNDAV